MILRLIDQKDPVFDIKDFCKTYNSNAMLKNFVNEFDSRLELVINNIQNDSKSGSYAKSKLKVDLKSHLIKHNPLRKAIKITNTPIESQINMFNVPLKNNELTP